MRKTIQSWGNSAAVRLPAEALKKLGWSINTAVEIFHERGGIQLMKAAPLSVHDDPSGLPSDPNDDAEFLPVRRLGEWYRQAKEKNVQRLVFTIEHTPTGTTVTMESQRITPDGAVVPLGGEAVEQVVAQQALMVLYNVLGIDAEVVFRTDQAQAALVTFAHPDSERKNAWLYRSFPTSNGMVISLTAPGADATFHVGETEHEGVLREVREALNQERWKGEQHRLSTQSFLPLNERLLSMMSTFGTAVAQVDPGLSEYEKHEKKRLVRAQLLTLAAQALVAVEEADASPCIGWDGTDRPNGNRFRGA